MYICSQSTKHIRALPCQHFKHSDKLSAENNIQDLASMCIILMQWSKLWWEGDGNTQRQTDGVCLPVVRSREDSDTFSSVGHFISFLFYLVTPDNKIWVGEGGERGWEGGEDVSGKGVWMCREMMYTASFPSSSILWGGQDGEQKWYPIHLLTYLAHFCCKTALWRRDQTEGQLLSY